MSSMLDRGRRGVQLRSPLVLGPGSYLDPTDGGPYLFEDFLADHVAEDSVVVVNQSGTAITAAAISATAGAPIAGHGGWLAGATDDVDAEIDEVALGAKPWLNPTALRTGGVIVAEIGFVIPVALTARQYFFGFSDDETEGTGTNGPLDIASGVTLDSTATDAAGFVFSSLATDANAFYMGAVKADTDGTPVASAAPLDTAVVDDYTKLRVEIDVLGSVHFYGGATGAGGRNEVQKKFLGRQNAAVTANILYLPVFSAAPTTTTSVEWEIDYLFGAATHAQQ